MDLQINKKQIANLSQTMMNGMGLLPEDIYTPTRIIEDVREEDLFRGSTISFAYDYQTLIDRISHDFAYGELMPDMHLIVYRSQQPLDSNDYFPIIDYQFMSSHLPFEFLYEHIIGEGYEIIPCEKLIAEMEYVHRQLYTTQKANV